MQTIGERIKLKRKEIGLTQMELAEKLNVTDRAVSKWEIGEGDPSISLLSSIAEVLHISIDYLLTGKEEETISIDDMDAEKREMLFIKRDDVKNFTRYGYVNSNIVLCPAYSSGRSSRSFETRILDAIYSNNSKKIFATLVRAALERKNELTQNLFNYDNIKALTVCGDLDKYIKMCSASGCVEGLEFIDLKFFKVGNTTSSERSYFHIREHNSPGERDYCTCTISLSTLKYVLNPDTSSDAVIDYMSDIELFKDSGKRVYFITDEVICGLYESGDEKRLHKIIGTLNEYNKYAAGIYNESLSGSWYTGKKLQNNAIYFSNSYGGGSYLRAYVYPISSALSLALNRKDIKWVTEFNEYNKQLNALIPDLKLRIYSEKELKIKKVEFDPKSSKEQIWEEKYLEQGMLDARAFLKEFSLYEKEEVSSLKESKKFLKSEVLPFLQKHPVCGRELIARALEKKDYKSLYKFAVDRGNKELEDAVLAADKSAILSVASHISCYDGFESELKSDELTSVFFEKYKNNYIESCIGKIDEIIEKITQEKKLENDYKDLVSSISSDYLLNELKKGNIENLVIKMCVRLEITFKYKYRYNGDLFEMMDEYFKNYLTMIPMFNPYDDEDNDYYNQLEADRKNTEINQNRTIEKDLLHKLRVLRNSYVHADKSNVVLSKDDLSRCITIVCNI